MSDGIDIPVNVDSTRAVVALEQVVRSLSGVQQQVLKAVEATDAGRPKVEALAGAFLEGKTSAQELRAALVALTGEVPKTAAELRRAADAAERNSSAWQRMGGSVRDARGAWESAIRPITGVVGALEQVAGAEQAVARGAVDTYVTMARLSAEHEHLARAQSALGINFTAVSDRLGRFIPETELATEAMRLHRQGAALTGEAYLQLGQYAGVMAQQTGGDAAEALHRLTDWVIRGRDRAHALTPELHAMTEANSTLAQRLEAVTRNQRDVIRATDDAQTSLQRMANDAQRTAREVGAGFIEESEQAGGLASELRGVDNLLRQITGDARILGHVFEVAFTTAAHTAASLATGGLSGITQLLGVAGNALGHGAPSGPLGAGAAGAPANDNDSEDGQPLTHDQAVAQHREEVSLERAQRLAASRIRENFSREMRRLNDAARTDRAALTGQTHGRAITADLEQHIRLIAPSEDDADRAIRELNERVEAAENRARRRGASQGQQAESQAERAIREAMTEAHAERRTQHVSPETLDERMHREAEVVTRRGEEHQQKQEEDAARGRLQAEARTRENKEAYASRDMASQFREQANSTNEHRIAVQGLGDAWRGSAQALGDYLGTALKGQASLKSFSDAMKATIGKALQDTAVAFGTLEANKAVASFADYNYVQGAEQAAAAVALYAAGAIIGSLMGSSGSSSGSAPSAGGAAPTSAGQSAAPVGNGMGSRGEPTGNGGGITVVFSGTVLGANPSEVARLGYELGNTINVARRDLGHTFVGERAA